MQKEEYDMEMTPERLQRVRETLVSLYCDQYGLELKSIEIIKKDSTDDPA